MKKLPELLNATIMLDVRNGVREQSGQDYNADISEYVEQLRIVRQGKEKYSDTGLRLLKDLQKDGAPEVQQRRLIAATVELMLETNKR